MNNFIQYHQYEIRETYEICETHEIARYNITTEENIMKEYIDRLLKYCDHIANIEDFMDMLELSKEEMIYHLKFIIDKMYFYLNVYETYIINELNKEYKQYEFILGQQYVNNIINIYTSNDVYIYDMKQTILILYDMIRELEINDNYKIYN